MRYLALKESRSEKKTRKRWMMNESRSVGLLIHLVMNEPTALKQELSKLTSRLIKDTTSPAEIINMVNYD